jgi:glyoxylase-like metal-dependent hydrolase (beta-lactamase superfamily II)
MASRVYAFHCGGVRSYRGFYDVIDERATEIVYEPSFFFLVEMDGKRILFDTGMNPRLMREDDGDIGVLMAESDALVPMLATVGVGLGDLDGVVVSHLHNDHAGGLEYLGGDVPVYVSESELEFAADPPVYQRPFYDREDLEAGTDWVRLSGEFDVLGDGRLTVIPTPGHTRGHQVLKVRLESRTIVLCADASYLADKMRARRLPGVVWNPDELVRSWELLEGIERDESALLVFTHDLDFRESKPLAPDAWYD